MKYTKKQITSLLEHKIGRIYGSDFVWRKEAEELISELYSQNERFRAALTLIQDYGGTTTETELGPLHHSGTWCSDQASFAIKESE